MLCFFTRYNEIKVGLFKYWHEYACSTCTRHVTKLIRKRRRQQPFNVNICEVDVIGIFSLEGSLQTLLDEHHVN